MKFDSKGVDRLLKELEDILGRLKMMRKDWEKQIIERAPESTEVALWNGEEVVLTGRTSDHGKVEILIKDTEYHWVHKMELSGVR